MLPVEIMPSHVMLTHTQGGFPVNGEAIASTPQGGPEDVDKAVAAARKVCLNCAPDVIEFRPLITHDRPPPR